MFITFEGPDGCGKTTQIALLVQHLDQQGYAYLQTREPGGTRIGEQIRDVLHDPHNEEMTSRAEMLLYAASRAQLVDEVVRPALARGEIVLADRFCDSTYAYQGYGRGLDLHLLRDITEFATGGLTPDLTFYLDVDAETGLRRRQADQAAEWNRLDAAEVDFHQRVSAGYRELIRAEPMRWVVVDGNKAVESVQQQIRGIVTERLAERQAE